MRIARNLVEILGAPGASRHRASGIPAQSETPRPAVFVAMHLMFFFALVLSVALNPVSASVDVTGTVELSEPVDWYYESDIGMSHVYGAEQFHTLDLFDRGTPLHEPIHLPGVEDPGSLVHLPAMPHLFVPRAQSKLLAHERDGGDFSSYLIDAFSGELLWEQASRSDVTAIFAFPLEDRFVIRTGQQGETFTGVELSSGKQEWSVTLPAKAVWTHGSALEIVGETSATIDAVTGKYLRRVSVSVPAKSDVVTFPGSNVIVVWHKDDFAAFEYPVLDSAATVEGGTERTVVAKKLWEFESKKKSPTKLCQMEHVPCGPMMLPENRVLINGVSLVELLDLTTGKTFWSRKEKRLISAAAVSPAGEYGAILDNKHVSIIDMKTGEDVREIRYPKGAKPKFVTLKPSANSWKNYVSLMAQVVWPNDDEVVVIMQDKKGVSRGVMRFHAEDRELVWGRELPEPADYPMTSSQRGLLVGRIFLAVALTAISAANPIPVGNTSYYYVFTPSWRVGGSPDMGSDPYTRAGLGDREVPQQFQESRQRYLRRREFFEASQDKDTIVVTGDHGTYNLESIDLKTDTVTAIGTYRGENIHAIDPDPAYRLAVTMEKQRRVLRVLSLVY